MRTRFTEDQNGGGPIQPMEMFASPGGRASHEEALGERRRGRRLDGWFLITVAFVGGLALAMSYVVLEAYGGDRSLLIGWLLCATVSGAWFMFAARGAIGLEVGPAPEGVGGDVAEASPADE